MLESPPGSGATTVTSQYHFPVDLPIVERTASKPTAVSVAVKFPFDKTIQEVLSAGFQVA